MTSLDRPHPKLGTPIVPPTQLTAVDYSGTTGWAVIPGYIGALTVSNDHIDEYGHVNNLIYPQWALEAAWHHSTKLGFPFSRFSEIGAGFVVWNHNFDYVAATIPGDRLLVATWIARNDKRTRLTRAYEMRHADTGKVVFRGETLFICIDMKTGKPRRMPEDFAYGYQPAETVS